MKQYWSCLALSCLTFTGIMLVIKCLSFGIIYEIIILFILEILIYTMYPVENGNRIVDEEENIYFKRRLKKFLILDLLLAVLCIVLKKESYLLLITTTICLVSVTMFIGKIKK